MVQFGLTSSSSAISYCRKKSLESLLNILTKHTLDRRYSPTKDQSRIAQLYCPFVGFITRNLQNLNIGFTDLSEFKRNPSMRSASGILNPASLDFDALKMMLKCFFHISANLNEDVISDFWSECSSFEIENFFAILSMAVYFFKFKETKKTFDRMPSNLRVSLRKTVTKSRVKKFRGLNFG